MEVSEQELRAMFEREPIRHLATAESGHTSALCGRLRDRPLDLNADGPFCVVCLDLYEQKHGEPFPA